MLVRAIILPIPVHIVVFFLNNTSYSILESYAICVVLPITQFNNNRPSVIRSHSWVVIPDAELSNTCNGELV